MPTAPTVRTSEALAEDLLAMELNRYSGTPERAGEAERKAHRLDRPDLAARARLVAADAHCRAGDLASAATKLDEVRTWAESADEPYAQARAHFLLSILHTCIGDLAEARRHGVLGVEHLPPTAPALIRGHHLIVLALTLDTVSDKDAARYHAEALDIAAAAGDHEMAQAVLNNMAYAACQAGDADGAAHIARRLRALSAHSGTALRPPDLDTLARVALALNDPAEAERLLLPLVDTGEVHTEGNMLSEILLTLAEAQRCLGAYDRARVTLTRSQRMCVERGLGEVGVRARKESARLHAACGEYREAYEEYVRQDAEAAALRDADREAQAHLTKLVFESREGRRDNERFRELALRDALTGLYNRRFVDGQLPALVERSAREGTALSAALVDIDFFKRVNDTLSHETGDHVLQRIAAVLSSVLVEPATVARLGGEEFVIVLPGTGPAEAAAICEQARAAVQRHDWANLVGDMPITVSIGFSSCTGGRITSSALLSQADRNLYAAKRSGRNRVFGDPA